MPDAPSSSPDPVPAPGGSAPQPPPTKPGGWPLWLRILLAVLLLSFVWSPFLAMLMRLSRVNPGLQPTGGNADFSPPAQPAPGSSPGPAAAPPTPAPSP